VKNFNDILVVTYASKKLKKVALNWVRHIEKLNIENYIVYSLDKETYEYLQKHNVKTQQTKHWRIKKVAPDGKGIFNWHQRFRMIRDLVASGKNVVCSDLDAIWHKNPLEFTNNDADIVSSRESAGIPYEVSSRMGFNLCLGWIFFRSTTSTLSFMDIILRKSRFDDQIRFNEKFFDNKTKSDITESQIGNIVHSNGVKLIALNENIISRPRISTENLVKEEYVSHFWFRKDYSSIEELLKIQKGCWILENEN
jgi:hypothetical protein